MPQKSKESAVAGVCLQLAYSILKDHSPGPENPTFSRCSIEQKMERIVTLAKRLTEEWERQQK